MTTADLCREVGVELTEQTVRLELLHKLWKDMAEKAKLKAKLLSTPVSHPPAPVQPPAPYPAAITLPSGETHPGYYVCTLPPLPQSLKTIEECSEGVTTCLLAPGVKEKILALPSFPQRLAVSIFQAMSKVRIGPAPGAGLGMFALRNIALGEIIIDERPLLLIQMGMIQGENAIDTAIQKKMPEAMRRCFFNLSNCKGDELPREQGIMNTNAMGVGSLPGCEQEHAGIPDKMSPINHRYLV